ncbi:MAG: TIGR03751 family conjugal transfer lipoprotein [Cellvibrionaceae bacterium]
MPNKQSIITIHWIKPVSVTLILFILLTGCSTSKEKIFKTDMPSMKTIYEEKFGKAEALKPTDYQRSLAGNAQAVSKKNQAVYESLKQQFPLTPNPMMMMYVFPHLTAAGTPVPGYHTYFKLYKTDSFYQLRDYYVK